MGEGIIGKFVYYWIFLIAGLVFGRMFGLTDTTPDLIILCVSLTILYIGFMLIRSNAKKKAQAKRAAEMAAPKGSKRRGKRK